MLIKQSNIFKRDYKRLTCDQKTTIDDIIRLIVEDLSIGTSLKGDFGKIRVFESISYTLQQDTVILLSIES